MIGSPLSVARGENEDGRDFALSAPGLEHCDAVHLGQAEVEHDRVIRLGLAEKLAVLAIAGGVDRVARFVQRPRELVAQVFIVLNHENAHR